MIEVQTVGKVDVDITVPGSKSLTQRALIAAALADGEGVVNHLDPTEVMVQCLQADWLFR